MLSVEPGRVTDEEALSVALSTIAIELLCACQGIDLLAPLKTGKLATKAYEVVRAKSQMLSVDRPVAPDIEAVSTLIADGAIAAILH